MARIDESGLHRSTHVYKVIRAPSTVIGEMFYDLSKKKHLGKERETTLVWKKNFMSECAFVKKIYLTPLCLRSALDSKVAAAVRSNSSREKFKENYFP